MSDGQELNTTPVNPFDGLLKNVQAKFDSIESKISSLEKLVQFREKESTGNRVRVMWQDKVTQSGIELGGSSAVAEYTGFLLGVSVIPTGPSSATLMVAVKADIGQQVVLLDISKISFLD